MAEEIVRPLRIMQSFRRIRPTTNPYIAMLDRALAVEPGLDHLRFTWRRAILGRYDAIHFHWPETLFGGVKPLSRAVKHLLFATLLARLRFSRIAVVRTAHNLELPADSTPLQRRLLTAVERLTTLRILLNPTTPNAGDLPFEVIPHGHYRDWFSSMERSERREGRIGFVGLVRRYKGLESLLEAFKGLPEAMGATLEIGGKPSSEELRTLLQDAAASDPRILLRARFLPDEELVEVVTAAQLVVLPYRLMHNSGTVLAALSLDTPVLVPDNEVNRLLADETGPGWVHLFAGELTSEDILRALGGTTGPRSTRPRLIDRDWSETAERHRTAFARAVAARRAPRERLR